MTARHSARATRALQALAEADPAFAALALWIDHRDAERPEDAPADTRLDGDAQAPAWTDGRTIFYGPGFAALPADVQMGVAAHQILHVALRHPARDRAMRLRLGDEADPRLFNIAADALVNETLIAAGYSVPRPCVTLLPLHAFLLRDEAPTASALAKWDAETLTLALKEIVARGRTAAPGAGDAPHSSDAAIEKMARKAAFAPDIEAREADPGGAAQAAEDDAEWQQRLSRALEEGRLAGRGIGALGLHLADIPRSEVPWERHLRSLVARALLPEPRQVWSRPARVWAAMEDAARRSGAPAPVYQPGHARARAIPRIAVGIDSSSSIDTARLRLFLGQVAGIARRSGAEVHALVFDDQVRSVQVLPRAAPEEALKRLDLSREGGTSFDGLFAEAGRLEPAILIVLTDLDAPVPPAPRGVPVLWAVPAPPAKAPPHGRVVDLSA